jgi:hypothetical protein
MTMRDLFQDLQIANLEAQQQLNEGTTTSVLHSLVVQVGQLRQEVARQNVAITVLTQMLMERGGVDGAELKKRFDEGMEQLRVAANFIQCPRCKRNVEKRYTQISASGVLCDPCHRAINGNE